MIEKFLYIALILLGVGLLSFCNKAESQDGLVGTWKVVYSEETLKEENLSLIFRKSINNSQGSHDRQPFFACFGVFVKS